MKKYTEKEIEGMIKGNPELLQSLVAKVIYPEGYDDFDIPDFLYSSHGVKEMMGWLKDNRRIFITFYIDKWFVIDVPKGEIESKWYDDFKNGVLRAVKHKSLNTALILAVLKSAGKIK